MDVIEAHVLNATFVIKSSFKVPSCRSSSREDETEDEESLEMESRVGLVSIRQKQAEESK